MGKARAMAVAFAVAVVASPAGGQGFLKHLEDASGGIGSKFGLGGSSNAVGALSNDEIGRGIKEALRVGTERLVGQLGAANGFNGDPEVRIPLPENLKRVQSALGRLGMSGMADDLELRLNRAAEAATPKAKKLFGDAITAMTLEDVKTILNGPSDSATRFFQGKMSTPLKAEFEPIVNASLADVGAINSYDKMMGQYKSLPFVPDVKADLTNHVLEKAIAGIFLYLGKEEAAIRADPAKRTTDLLKKVFAK
jgi:hypothetical protein